MKPSTRWTIVILVVIAIGIIWLLWPKRDEQPAPPKAPVASQPPAPKPEPAPPPTPEPAPPSVKPQPEGPVTASIHFSFDSSVVQPAEAPKLDEFAGRIKGSSFDRLDAVGHADRIGTSVYNLGLSKRRAEAVQAYLAGKGVEAARIRVEAKGEDQSVTGDACKKMGPENRKNRKLIECLQRDRRVELSAAR
jgi:OOP family OmpA-OmpF porin